MTSLQRLGWYHSIELPGGEVIPGLQTIEQLRTRVAQFPIPADLRGKRVLDIGAWDGWFSFEMERRGAEVVALDYVPQERFFKARELLGSRVRYETGDICRISPARLGRFDIVLFFGVLYHVKHPLLALEKVCELSTDMVCIESYVTGADMSQAPLIEFYETTELLGQFDNWHGPNLSALMALCRTAGFARVSFESTLGNRAHVTCYRHWSAAPGAADPPLLTCVANSVTRDHEFSSGRDDYVAFWFETEPGLTTDDVMPEIGPYGTRAACLYDMGGKGWHLNCKLPPGLEPGWHDCRLRTPSSAYSNALRIAVDVPLAERLPSSTRAAHEIVSVTDGRTWDEARVKIGEGSCLSLWARGLPDVSMRRCTVRLNGSDLAVVYISRADEHGVRQVNAMLPSGLKPGAATVTLTVNGAESAATNIELV
jgi:tRNA (mo5U34)-methyltransferase